MNEQESAIAASVEKAMNDYSNNSARSLQSKDVIFGPSSIGWCSTKMLRQLRGEVEPDGPKIKAFLGTAIGEHVEAAFWANNPDAVTQPDLTVTFEGENGRTYTLPGHADILIGNMVLDVKTVDGLGVVRRTGASQSQRFQRSLYGLGAIQCGLLDCSLEDLMVGNIWVDRSGAESTPHVQVEPFDMEEVRAAGRWVDEVLWAYENGEDAPKEPPRNVCMVTCGFAPVCREYDTDVEGLIRDEEQLAAVEAYAEGLRLDKEAKAMKDSAKAVLKGVTGWTLTHSVRTTLVNESEVPAHVRAGYEKVECRPRSKAHLKQYGESGDM